MPIAETSEVTFERDVLECDRPVLVDFWGPSCLPCQVLEPKLEALSEDLADQLHVVRVAWPEQSAICDAYRVSSVPTLLFFHRGLPMARFDGYSRTTDLERRLKELLIGIA